jgi:hypothetical protein
MAYSTIPKGSLYMSAKLYTGNGSSGHDITLPFSPDFTWIKERGATQNHFLFDKVRGDNKYINSNTSDQEYTESGGMALGTNKFTLGNWGSVNNNSDTFASWNWKANGQGSSNTAGSINTTYTSVNTTAGFSISSYTGTGSLATVGHGLGVAPSMIITKVLTTTHNWGVYHQGLGNTSAIYLDLPNDKSDDAAWWNNTSPTSNVFTINTRVEVNQGSQNYISYCFAEKQGFSKFGIYTGNGATLGPFVYCGFKPSFIIVKKTSGSGSWWMRDNQIAPYNQRSQVIVANSNGAETSGVAQMDFLSNGFKLRDTTDASNSSGGSYIYMVFASNPFVATSGSDAVPVTAE